MAARKQSVIGQFARRKIKREDRIYGHNKKMKGRKERWRVDRQQCARPRGPNLEIPTSPVRLFPRTLIHFLPVANDITLTKMDTKRCQMNSTYLIIRWCFELATKWSKTEQKFEWTLLSRWPQFQPSSCYGSLEGACARQSQAKPLNLADKQRGWLEFLKDPALLVQACHVTMPPSWISLFSPFSFDIY